MGIASTLFVPIVFVQVGQQTSVHVSSDVSDGVNICRRHNQSLCTLDTEGAKMAVATVFLLT